ncbi:hypothetical protein BCR33DRAFT_498940 [Rhizoclosmatium globosum]|uniref:Uncharacterized protein n=1 Tax=Rhizoclosmatium globosum TaxID=329046 RepID=A0A1Y2CV85_9FUNG|nr:hypothetical protein BCR33DRAFT_498940 [Rhizoclosmatium globosum]|eukprot:ORY50951.1 hypothetical protein BCR33DRAFT_498940 [Rhizoclosmatium globosum]
MEHVCIHLSTPFPANKSFPKYSATTANLASPFFPSNRPKNRSCRPAFSSCVFARLSTTRCSGAHIGHSFSTSSEPSTPTHRAWYPWRHMKYTEGRSRTSAQRLHLLPWNTTGFVWTSVKSVFMRSVSCWYDAVRRAFSAVCFFSAASFERRYGRIVAIVTVGCWDRFVRFQVVRECFVCRFRERRGRSGSFDEASVVRVAKYDSASFQRLGSSFLVYIHQ